MKKITNKYIVVVVLLVGTSCGEDFLDLQPPLNVSNTEFLQTVDDFQAAIIGAYDQMQLADWYGRYMILIPDVMGEDVKQNASANRGAAWAEYAGAATTTQDENEEFWEEIYEGINMVNAMINSEFVPPASRQAEFDDLIGQAYAYRALAYFDLVRLFAQHYTFTSDASHRGVPIVLEFDVDLKPARDPVAEVYTQIVSDFEAAINLLDDADDPGILSKQGAQALLSRVYLYMGEYEEAETLATEVINSGNFDLVDAGEYTTQFFDGKSSEAIFEIVFDIVDNPGANHIGGMYKASGYGDYLPSQDFFDLLIPGDIRWDIFADDDNLDNGPYANEAGEGIRVNKFPSEGSDIASDNVPVIRLSEVYLTRAEARVKKATPDESGALADLNTIHLRANPSGTPYALSGQVLEDEVLRERRRELCFEGHRVFDITRNQQNLNRVDCTARDAACQINYPNDRFILAIPQAELNANINMRQNDGYGV